MHNTLLMPCMVYVEDILKITGARLAWGVLGDG